MITLPKPFSYPVLLAHLRSLTRRTLGARPTVLAAAGLALDPADRTAARDGAPLDLTSREVAHTGLTEMRIVGSLHERKAVMSALSDAVVALPGGCGTMDELFEAITWGQLGLHEKPIGLLDVDGYFDGEPTVVEVLMHRLRRKIERPGRPAAIQTVRGEGYIIRDQA